MSLRGPGQPPQEPTDPAGFLTEPLPTGAEESRKADLDHLKRLGRDRQRKLVRAGLLALALVLLIVFVLQNAQPVGVHLLFFSGQTLLIWVIVACAALGAVVGYLLARPSKTTRLHGGPGGPGGMSGPSAKGRRRRP
jgi:uncharacterized integral membrane protein